jgi:hypothetical protein
MFLPVWPRLLPWACATARHVPDHSSLFHRHAASKRQELEAAIASIAKSVDLIAAVALGTSAVDVATSLCTAATTAPSTESPTPDCDGPRGAVVGLCVAAVARAEAMRRTVSFDTSQHAWEGLCQLRAAGLRLLAEYTALSMQHLSFLAMCLDTGDVAAAGLPDGAGAALAANKLCS